MSSASTSTSTSTSYVTIISLLFMAGLIFHEPVNSCSIRFPSQNKQLVLAPDACVDSSNSTSRIKASLEWPMSVKENRDYGADLDWSFSPTTSHRAPCPSIDVLFAKQPKNVSNDELLLHQNCKVMFARRSERHLQSVILPDLARRQEQQHQKKKLLTDVTITGVTPTVWSRAGITLTVTGSGFNSLIGSHGAMVMIRAIAVICVSITDTQLIAQMTETSLQLTGGGWASGYEYPTLFVVSTTGPFVNIAAAFPNAGVIPDAYPVVTAIRSTVPFMRDGPPSGGYIPLCASVPWQYKVEGIFFPNDYIYLRYLEVQREATVADVYVLYNWNYADQVSAIITPPGDGGIFPHASSYAVDECAWLRFWFTWGDIGTSGEMLASHRRYCDDGTVISPPGLPPICGSGINRCGTC